jgi:hypothetical protein
MLDKHGLIYIVVTNLPKLFNYGRLPKRSNGLMIDLDLSKFVGKVSDLF